MSTPEPNPPNNLVSVAVPDVTPVSRTEASVPTPELSSTANPGVDSAAQSAGVADMIDRIDSFHTTLRRTSHLFDQADPVYSQLVERWHPLPLTPSTSQDD